MYLKQIVAFVLCVAIRGYAADTAGRVTQVNQAPDGVEIHSERALLRINVLSPSVVRVRYSRSGAFKDKTSFAVVSDPGFGPVAPKVLDGRDFVVVDTGDFNVGIEKDSSRVIFEEHSGKVILQDHPGSPVSWNGDSFRVWKSMSPDEHYFALGDKAGVLDHRNQAYTLWNTDTGGFDKGMDPLYKAIPFFIGMNGPSAYGVFLDNTYWSSFDFGKEKRDAISFGAEDGELDYYFFYGPDPKAVVGEYTQLTGRTPLPPLFMLGYQQCRWTYAPESRAREIASQFRNLKIPADAIWLDIGYQQDNAPFTVNDKEFPNFSGFIHDLGDQGFKVILITDLDIKKQPGYKPYDEGLAGDHFVKNPDGSVFVGPVWPGPSVFPDFTQAAARKWWGTLFTDFVNMGVRGFWNDMNEPSVFNAEKTMPLNVVHRVDNGSGERVATHREIHNVYGMANVRATYEGMLALRPDVRPVVMTRAGYAGTQRYAATWTGDTSSTWTHLGMSVPMLLNLGLSGYPLAGDDIGGFGGSSTPDLLTRWIELGAFNTIYRNHSSIGTADQEPWVGPPEHVEIRKKFIETRYRLLPYIYTSMEETSRTGIPLMRPMFLEFPSEGNLATIDSEFMFGHDLLVVPQLNEMPDPLHVELASGEWYDYWTGSRVTGSRSFDRRISIGELPVYVRAGAIIPQQPVIQHVEEVPKGPLELRVFPGSDCHGSIYTDDGNSFAYRRGVFSRTKMTCSSSSGKTMVNIAAAEGSYVPWWKELQVVVYGADKNPARVLVDGKVVDNWKFDGAAQSVTVRFAYRSAWQSVQIDY